MPPEIDYGSLDYQHWTPVQRAAHLVIRFLVRLLFNVTVEGLEHVPERGAFVLAVNHLDYFDAPIVFAKMPRRMVAFAADKWKNSHFTGLLLTYVGTAIYVDRGAPDRKALDAALTVLKTGGALAMAPEGTRSPTGGLTEGHTGVAYLATRAAVPILPMVAYGQEKSEQYWKRLRRVPVHVRIGPLIELPSGKARTEQLHAYTDQLMLTLARMLPAQYRGVYAERVKG